MSHMIWLTLNTSALSAYISIPLTSTWIFLLCSWIKTAISSMIILKIEFYPRTFFFEILPKQTGQHSPFFKTGVVQFFNSFEKVLDWNSKLWIENPWVMDHDSPLNIWTFVFEKAWFWFTCNSSIDANASHTFINSPWVTRIRHNSFFGKTTFLSFGNMFNIRATGTAWSRNADRRLTGQWRTDVIWAHDKWCHTTTDGAFVI